MQYVKNETVQGLASAYQNILEILIQDADQNVLQTLTVIAAELVLIINVLTHVLEPADLMPSVE